MDIKTMSGKTLYFLGAGFSMDAGAPSQARIIEKCLEINKLNPEIFTNNANNAINKFKEMMQKYFLINTDDDLKKIALEDIFTALDKSIIDKSSFRGMTISEIEAHLRNLVFIIGKTIDHSISASDFIYIETFAKHATCLSKNRISNGIDSDPVSIISTNWDIALDKAIYRLLENIRRDEQKNGVVDYCCYVSSYERNDESIKPGLLMLGKANGFNVKLLKIHGSLNWLQCNLCGRLYVSFSEKIGLLESSDIYCRHCKENFKEEVQLQRNTIMPTFVKDFSNHQYKLIWQNAGIELSESSHIVFIGYSLPQADYEIRQLLSRMVRKDAKITVVTLKKGINDVEYDNLQSRYRIFFGNREIEFFDGGAKEYIMRHCN
jgi:hypothetical protein